jgi:hypothetical protein
MKRDLARLLRRIASEPGWTVHRCGSGHWQVRGPASSCTARGHRADTSRSSRSRPSSAGAGVPERLITGATS